MYIPDPLASSSAASAGLGMMSLTAGQDVLSVGVLFFATMALTTAAWSVVHRVRRRVVARESARGRD